MSEILTAPSPVLSQISKTYIFQKNDRVLPTLLSQMEEALLAASDPKGVGLAAPQIGKSLTIFMIKPTEKSKISVFINPKILDSQTPNPPNLPNRPKKRIRKLEGCLSLPNIWGEVLRSPSVTLEFQTPNGRNQTKKFTGFMATIIQHEIDHLEGILFPRRVLEQKGRLYKSHKNKKGENIFEELKI
ncbi:MAG: peptide deformylase [Candidatus Levybacteria bacterium]|nr:peptide deformylase [Candidatus Levybacteria bacterium]